MLTWVFSPVGIAWATVAICLALLSRLRFGWFVFWALLFVGLGSLGSTYLLVSVPLPENVGITRAAELYDRHGRLIATYSEGRRIIIDKKLPEHLTDAVIAAEDHDFFEHRGIDYGAIVRAAVRNLRDGGIVQGGSTITQQYVKIALLHDHSRTLTRKVKEAALAAKLEARFTKQQILSFYLNTVYMGRGAYGIEAASRTYFGKSARKLSLKQSAYLAGMIRAPEAYQLDHDPEAATVRTKQVLVAMEELGSAPRGSAEKATTRPLRLKDGLAARVQRYEAPYFTEWVRRNHLEDHSDCLRTCGLKIHTTLDLAMQHAAERAVAGIVKGKRGPQVALVSMTPRGEVRAMVGGRDLRSRVAAAGFNHATDLPGRQAGSAFKPIALAAALEAGISPHTNLPGQSPTRIGRPCTQAGNPWTVNNYGGRSYGTLSLRQATIHSVNTAYAHLVTRAGPRSTAQLTARLGFARAGTPDRRKVRQHCSLALGTMDVTPLEMARAYAAFAGQGRLPSLTPITKVEDRSGSCLETFVGTDGCTGGSDPSARRVMKTSTAETVTDMLKEVVTSGTGRAAYIGVPAAGKTGTSQQNVDAWFVGYTPDLVTAVWVGYPIEDKRGFVPQMRSCSNRKRCRPVKGREVTGGSLPAQIWAHFMSALQPKHDVRGNDEGPSHPVPASGGKPSPADTPARREDEAPDPPAPAPSPSPSRQPVVPLPPIDP